MERYEEAIKDYEKAIEYPHDSHVYHTYYNKGICLRKLGRLDKSIDDLKKAVDMKPDNPNAHNNLGLSYFENKEFDEALTEYTKAIQHSNIDKNTALDEKKKAETALHYNNRGLAYLHLEKLLEA